MSNAFLRKQRTGEISVEIKQMSVPIFQNNFNKREEIISTKATTLVSKADSPNKNIRNIHNTGPKESGSEQRLDVYTNLSTLYVPPHSFMH